MAMDMVRSEGVCLPNGKRMAVLLHELRWDKEALKAKGSVEETPSSQPS